MSLPSFFPDPLKNQKLVQELLNRIRQLNSVEKKRLAVLLDTDADLPGLDRRERAYRERLLNRLSKSTDHKTAVELSNNLRSRFLMNLDLQREYLHARIREVLAEPVAAEDPSMSAGVDQH